MTRHHPNASSSNFQSVINAALDAYEKKTESNLVTHPLDPLAKKLESCDSVSAFISEFEDLVQQFDGHRKSDQSITKWLNPTVKVLYALCEPLGEIFSPAKMVFSGIGILLKVSIIIGL